MTPANEVGEQTESAPSDDLRSLIEAAAADVDIEPAKRAEKTAVSSADSAEKDESATGQETGQRDRDERGRFKPKEGDEEKAPAVAATTKAAVATETPPPGAQTQEQKPPPTAAAPDPTARWSAEDKAIYKTLPPAAQEFVTRRYKEMEADYTRKTQDIAEFRRAYEPVDQLFAPFKPQMKAQGWTEASLIKAWADVEQDLMGGRGAKRVADIIRSYKLPHDEILKELGVGPAQVSGAAPSQVNSDPNAPQLDPAVVPLLERQFGAFAKPLFDQLQQLTSAEQQRQQTSTRLEQQRVAQEQQRAMDQVKTFVEETAADGSPLHPHFQDVSGHMVALAKAEREAGRTPDLQAVYDQAVWANPQTREKLLAAQQAAQAEKTRQESVAKAAQAKKAASSVQGAPGSGHASSRTGSAPNKSLRDIIAEAADAVGDA